MKLVADSHALVWFTQGSEQISETALTALREAENNDGIGISVATFIDLWYVTQTTKAISERELSQLHSLVTAPGAGVEISPITLGIADHYQSISRALLRDPWDRLIVATAMYHA
ncbi:MAG: type II toxin-antitoxin system VapC family toxin, partial [Mycobacteriales bacterium]